MEAFIAAVKAAEKLTQEKEELRSCLEDSRLATSTMIGENHQLRLELQAVKAALGVAVDTSIARKVMVVELTAQISMLGKLFIHCSDEVVKIVAALPKQPAPETETTFTGTENMEVETVGPLVGKPEEVEKPTVPFAQKGREHLLSETVIPTPAFLRGNGGSKLDEMNTAFMDQLTYKERKYFVKDGTIPLRLRRFSSG